MTLGALKNAHVARQQIIGEWTQHRVDERNLGSHPV
jgi:hypothetical protein